jgi:hypothetical protein
MARSRTEPTNTSTQTKERKVATALNAGRIAELLAKQKSRGDYDAELREFLAGGEAGIEVPLTEGRFTGKSAKMVQTGFNNARKRTNEGGQPVHPGGSAVKVIVEKDDSDVEHVFLINTAVAAE